MRCGGAEGRWGGAWGRGKLTLAALRSHVYEDRRHRHLCVRAHARARAYIVRSRARACVVRANTYVRARGCRCE